MTFGKSKCSRWRAVKVGLVALGLWGTSLVAGGAEQADEQAVRRAIAPRLGDVTIIEVRRLAAVPLYEVALRGADGVKIVYTDKSAKMVFIGNLVDAASGVSVTETRMRRLTSIDWKTLPFDDAITMRRGNGRREIAVFSDPNCPFCERFERGLATLDDITVHIFMYPVIKADSVRQAKAVWCSADRAKAWNDLMFNRVEPKARTDCATPVDRLLELGRKLGAVSTPTWFVRSGEMYKGALPMEEVTALLDAQAARPPRR